MGYMWEMVFTPHEGSACSMLQIIVLQRRSVVWDTWGRIDKRRATFEWIFVGKGLAATRGRSGLGQRVAGGIVTLDLSYRGVVQDTSYNQVMTGVAITGFKPSAPDPGDRKARLDALFAKRDQQIRAGLETWDYDRINKDVYDRRGTEHRGE